MRLLLSLLILVGTMATASAQESDFARTKARLEEDRVELVAMAKALLQATPEVAHEYVAMLDDFELKTNDWMDGLRDGRLSRVWTQKAGRLQSEEVPWTCLVWWASQLRTTAIDFKRAAVLYAQSADGEYLKQTGKSLLLIEPGSIYLPKCD
jgi:hypothetical protein